MKRVRLLAIALVVVLVAVAVGLSMSSNVAPKSTAMYIGNVRTYVFHRESCHYLPYEKNRTYFDSRQKAIEAGYRACRKCKP